jgi:hypothetical protein
MKIALFHNPSAGDRSLDGSRLIRYFVEAGNDVTYVVTNQKGWESAFKKPIGQAVIAGGDGTVSGLAPWLAARKIPFWILALGTANNCAKTLGQIHPIEVVVAKLKSAKIKKVDLGMVTTPVSQNVPASCTTHHGPEARDSAAAREALRSRPRRRPRPRIRPRGVMEYWSVGVLLHPASAGLGVLSGRVLGSA